MIGMKQYITFYHYSTVLLTILHCALDLYSLFATCYEFAPLNTMGPTLHPPFPDNHHFTLCLLTGLTL